MLLAFAPFIAFAVLNHFVTPTVALVIAALVSLGLIGREILPGRSTIQYARESVPKNCGAAHNSCAQIRSSHWFGSRPSQSSSLPIWFFFICPTYLTR